MPSYYLLTNCDPPYAHILALLTQKYSCIFTKYAITRVYISTMGEIELSISLAGPWILIRDLLPDELLNILKKSGRILKFWESQTYATVSKMPSRRVIEDDNIYDSTLLSILNSYVVCRA